MPPSDRLRILGVSVPDVSDWHEAVPQGQWSLFFSALAERFELVDVVRPELSRTERYINLARTFHPRRRRWRASAGFNRWLASRRTATAECVLAGREDTYDLIMQIQTVCAPGSHPPAPYAIYTDNTMALTQRLYPDWAPLSRRKAAWWTRYEAEVCRSAAVVFTFSEFARRSVIDDYGVAPGHVISVGAGANQMLETLGNKDYAIPRALFVGVDFERKGGSVLLEAWSAVRNRVPDAELVIAGLPGDSRPDLPAGVSWIGWVDRTELANLYRSASVFVLPSIFDPCPNVLREAMGYGLPCVSTYCCAIPEIIDDGVTGSLVPPSESAPLADALIEMFTDPVKTATMGQAAHRKVMEGNRWVDVVNRIGAHLAR
jgi:glycosyltransferase involved in cell wall biosynthesis